MRSLKIEISPSHPDYKTILNEMIVSKEIYNSLNFLMRQQYLKLQNKSFSEDLTDDDIKVMDAIVYNVNYPYQLCKG